MPEGINNSKAQQAYGPKKQRLTIKQVNPISSKVAYDLKKDPTQQTAQPTSVTIFEALEPEYEGWV